MMTGIDTSSTNINCAAPTVKGEAPAMRAYRIRKAFAVVHFEAEGKGRIVFLPEGAKLRIVGPSRLSECFEVLCEDQLYNIFKVDLLGPWSNPIRRTPITGGPIKTSRMKPIRALAMGACA